MWNESFFSAPQLKRTPLGRALFDRAVLLFVLVLAGAGIIWLLSDSPTDQTRTLAYLAFSVYAGWWAIRGLRAQAAARKENEVFSKAQQLEKTDPVAADQLLDSYFTKRGQLAAQERAQLWTAATEDRRAAARLERLLKEELKGHEVMRRRWLPTLPGEERSAAAEMIQKKERQTRDELEKLRIMRKELTA